MAKRTRRAFGGIRKLKSNRYQANFTGPDGRLHKAPSTFATKLDAEAWLADRRREIDREVWNPITEAVNKKKDARKLLFRDYAEDWLAHRPLKARSREHYRKLLDALILPKLGPLPLASITSDDIKKWHTKLGDATPTMRAHAYGLTRTIFGSAVSDGKAVLNPCQIRGAGSARRVHKIRPATLDELEALTAAMPENERAMILLASWCALRFGELTELRRKDIEVTEQKVGNDTVKVGVIRVRRAVVRAGGGFQVTTPKSDAGVRDVAIPPHLIPAIEAHLLEHVAPEKDALLFPAGRGGHLAPATLYRRFYAARSAAGRDDLRFHDLRHSGAVLAAATGASLAELMARLGHSTPQAAMKYQHVAQGRDAAIAAALSSLAAKG